MRRIYLLMVLIGGGIGRGMSAYPVGSEDRRFVVIWVLLVGAVVTIYLLRSYPLSVRRGVLLVALFGVVVEYIGVKTCVPYGCFTYSEITGPTFLQTFPYVLLIIWPVIVICSIQFFPSGMSSYWKKLLRATGCLLLFDLFLDPVAVDLGVWSYQSFITGASRYGVPLSNYLGRLPVGLMSVWLLLKFAPELEDDRFFRSFGSILFVSYLTYFLLVIV